VGNPQENFGNVLADMRNEGFSDEARILNVCTILSDRIQVVFSLIDNKNELTDTYIHKEFYE
jgi:hypothetical protein